MAARHVAVALDYSPSSRHALTWGLENIVRQGDHLLLIVVQKLEDEDGFANLWEESGSPLISLKDFRDASLNRKYHLTTDQPLIDELDAAAKGKHLTITVKVYFGDARVKIAHAVVEHSVDALVMGHCGQGGLKRMLLGSVSNYVVNNAPCPVTVVKLPEEV